ncbi:MAG: cobyric acid synthase [Eubacterium sp.]|nr:cobyric acid synthase [Eubacterium sp.]
MKNKAKNIMFQGTGSSVGKSLLTAGICRILRDRGFRVAPYKSQNMALNSYITADGKEMGRAQVVQAECAGIEPRVEMNPVLLKPNTDIGSQVILMGKAEFNMDATDYHAYKAKLAGVVMEAYNRLAEDYEIIAIEGAGSPAEINLRENDIVNMGLAEMVDAPVILIGDIDRGGVFASLYGTVMLLEPEERARIKGFIINKFRGDVALLQPGIEMLEEKINIPCLGVIPYERLIIDDEDSVTERWIEKKEGSLTIGVVRLRHISNFTDCTVFDMYPDVNVEYYDNQRALHRADPDLLVIPGSKNTIDDVIKLRESRLADEIIKKHEAGVPIIGICGGYQIIGREILDPHHVESHRERVEGLGLLDMITVLEAEKTTTRIEGTMVSNFLDMDMAGCPVAGYEIHMGETTPSGEVTRFAALEDGRSDGGVSADGMVMGTYLHGVFDNDDFRDKLLKALAKRKKEKLGETFVYDDAGRIDFQAFKESQYDLLAQSIEKNMDIPRLLEIIGV